MVQRDIHGSIISLKLCKYWPGRLSLITFQKNSQHEDLQRSCKIKLIFSVVGSSEIKGKRSPRDLLSRRQSESFIPVD